MKIFKNEEQNQIYTQFLRANIRGDFETAKKLAKILSEYDEENSEFQKLLWRLGIKR